MSFLKHWPSLLLGVLFLGGTSLWELFAQEQKLHIQEIFYFQVERTADQMMRFHLQGRSTKIFPSQGILGFGVYGPSGEALNGWGEAPENLFVEPGPLGPEGRSVIRRADDVYDFTKVLDSPRPRQRMMEEDAPRREMSPPRNNMRPPAEKGPLGFLFLRIQAKDFASHLWGWDLAAFLGPFLWAGILLLIGFLWYRNRNFQAELVHHRELLQFAEASRTLSHEIKNPLSAIMLQTALVKKRSIAAGEEVSEEILTIEEETRRIAQLVERVREFLRDPLGQPQVLDIWQAADQLRTLFDPPISVFPDLSPGLLIRFDPPRLRSVLENLLKNACESGANPRPEVHIFQPRTGVVRLEVLDRGNGLDPEVLRRAFSPFFTTKIQGSGIGLSIAQSFIAAGGGKITLENRPDGGARAALEFPSVSGVEK